MIVNEMVLFHLIMCIIPLATCSSRFPIQLSITQQKKFSSHQDSTYTQYVNIEIKTDENIERHQEISQELFLILDTSNSMQMDNKLIDAKLAIEYIIRNMNSKDKLHLIQYNSRSSIVFEDQNDRNFMLEKLKPFETFHGTNLTSAFHQMTILLQKYSQRTGIKRIFIFSDGKINKNVIDHPALLHELTSMKQTYDVTICSFGVGLDFDEELMMNIADYGSGDYLFIQGPESMRKVIEITYKNFQALIGTDAYLKIITQNDAHSPDESQIIPIGDVFYNDRMNILLENILANDNTSYMIVELWMTDIQDQISKLILIEDLLFSLNQSEDFVQLLKGN